MSIEDIGLGVGKGTDQGLFFLGHITQIALSPKP